MTSRHDPGRRPEGEPSELSEVFRQPVAPLEPPPGAYDDVRRRARGRRTSRTLWSVIAAAGCVAAVAVAVSVTGDSAPSTVAASPEDTSSASHHRSASGQRDDRADAGTGTPDDLRSDNPAKQHEDSASAGDGASQGWTGPAVCKTKNLTVSLGAGEGAAGSLYRPLRVTNNADAPCTLYGFPGVSMVDSAGHQVGKPADRSGDQALGRVVMKPGQREEVTLRILNAAVATDDRCERTAASGIRVYPPGERASTVLSVKGLEGCRSGKVTTLTVTSYGVHP